MTKIIQEKEDDIVNRDASSRRSKFILTVELRVIADKLNIGFEKNRGTKSITKILGLNNLKNGAVLEEN